MSAQSRRVCPAAEQRRQGARRTHDSDVLASAASRHRNRDRGRCRHWCRPTLVMMPAAHEHSASCVAEHARTAFPPQSLHFVHTASAAAAHALLRNNPLPHVLHGLQTASFSLVHALASYSPDTQAVHCVQTVSALLVRADATKEPSGHSRCWLHSLARPPVLKLPAAHIAHCVLANLPVASSW